MKAYVGDLIEGFYEPPEREPIKVQGRVITTFTTSTGHHLVFIANPDDSWERRLCLTEETVVVIERLTKKSLEDYL